MTKKMTKAQLVEALKSLKPRANKTKELIATTIAHAATLKRDELQEVFDSVKPKSYKPAAEALKVAQKPSATKSLKKTTKKADSKTTTKSKPKSTKAKKSDPEKSIKEFKDSLILDKTKLIKSADLLKYEDIKDVIESDSKELRFLVMWTPEQIKEFDYSKIFDVEPLKSFPQDYDVLVPVVTCDTIDKIVLMSIYTEAMYSIKSFKRDKDGFRRTNSAEYEIYEVAE